MDKGNPWGMIYYTRNLNIQEIRIVGRRITKVYIYRHRELLLAHVWKGEHH